MKTKKKLFLLLFALIIFSCTNENDRILNNKDKSTITIDSNKSLNDYSGIINGKLSQLNAFKGITQKSDYEIKYVDIHKAYYLHGRGFDQNGDHVIFRQKVEIIKFKNGSQDIKFMRSGESCTGVNCTKCSFAENGGCDCDRAGDVSQPSYCNHKVEITHEGGD